MTKANQGWSFYDLIQFVVINILLGATRGYPRSILAKGLVQQVNTK